MIKTRTINNGSIIVEQNNHYNDNIFFHCKMNIDINIKKACPCDIGLIIKDHIPTIMQLLTNDMPQYNFRMQTTKCLNTAIMMMQFLLGKKGLGIADSCDTREVISRHTSGVENNVTIINELTKQLFSVREKARTIYYILLSDGYFNISQTNSSSTKYFPGHVFILEKVWDTVKKCHYFYFYQSYINKYTLKEHYVMNKGLKISSIRAKELITHLKKVLLSETWSNDNVKRWYDMTFADSSTLLDTASQQKFFLCFRKAKTTVCLEKLEKYLQKKAKQVYRLSKKNPTIVYGDTTLYEEPSKALTNIQILEEINILLKQIEKQK